MPCSYYAPGTIVQRVYRDPVLQRTMQQAEQKERALLQTQAQMNLKNAEMELAHERQVMDELTHHGCLLREYFLEQVSVRSPYRRKIEKAQIEHRSMDLARLADTLHQKLIRCRSDQVHTQLLDKLWRVQQASPYIPLESQIGFDPDSI